MGVPDRDSFPVAGEQKDESLESPDKRHSELFKAKSECKEEWKKKLRRKMDGVSFTLGSIIFTLMVCS